MTSRPWVSVVAQTYERAEQLADALGLTYYRAFDVEHPSHFEGARTDRVLIESGTQVPIGLMENIYGTAVKLYGGKVLWVSAKEFG
ncbi:hypothetical protein ADZZY_44 [Mycobacterium phage Adzzy]|uniref:hypothetical protein n=1 Tax=Mycobacterium phage Adzzy TaxID=1383059 RepID=UPI00038810CA|nr:hypothetical protein ADZZY_44 [Mycobacterium phage Adzzy]AGT14293.1 hypothetical protein ADZZY_44 [Mycobacterium phage Adzzy]